MATSVASSPRKYSIAEKVFKRVGGSSSNSNSNNSSRNSSNGGGQSKKKKKIRCGGVHEKDQLEYYCDYDYDYDYDEDDGTNTLELAQIGAERTKNVLILMSDTGGGHRASAEAIRDAFRLEFGDEYRVCFFVLSFAYFLLVLFLSLSFL